MLFNGDSHHQRRLSIELERHLVYRDGLDHYPALTGPLMSATPFDVQSILHQAVNEGWQAWPDPSTGVLSRAARGGPDSPMEGWETLTSDVTSGIFETTIAPATSIAKLDLAQRHLDTDVAKLLGERGLQLLSLETPLVTQPSREHYELFHTYWRGDYALRRHRGEDHSWFSWTIGNNPSVDVTVAEAIPFLNLVLRLTGVTLFLCRNGSISGGRLAPGGRLTVRPWALSQLWRGGYPADAMRCDMMPRDFTGWADYLSTLASLPVVSIADDTGRPCRIATDPPLDVFWEQVGAGSVGGTDLWGHAHVFHTPLLQQMDNVQRQVFFSRLRWTFHSSADHAEFSRARSAGERELQRYLRSHLNHLYLEIRSDSCPPTGEEFATLSMYRGLVENLTEANEFVMSRPWSFWREVFDLASTSPMDVKVHDEWLPDVIAHVLAISQDGLARTAPDEIQYLAPLITRAHDHMTPAERARRIFLDAGPGWPGCVAVAAMASDGS